MDASSLPTLLLAFGVGYALGSIPFGLLLTRLAGLGDVRQIGSGNIGATNVLRTGRKGLAAATLLLDAAKGAVAVLIAHAAFGPTAATVAGFGALLGHIFPVWLKFKGGKGVATFLGVLIALAWQLAAVFAIVWLAVAATTRISSLSALVATVAVPVAAFLMGYEQIAIAVALMGAIILVKHRANIRRLLAGEEPKIGAKA
ncbi:MAG: glycerol-3-phosphate 1-O-acyltransferase PlsY [Hyphomicrobium denitrificans]|nr:glycerol-3-phosphate 1-O-acyltransferase PlsY [Hyphomicrobium denitrificans]